MWLNRTSHSWDMAISKFDLQNPSSRSWSKFKLTKWIQHPIDSHSLYSMSNWQSCDMAFSKSNLDNPKSRVRSNSTIHRQDHKPRSHSGSNILSTHIPFIPCQLPLLLFQRYSYIKIWPWKSKVRGEVKFNYMNPGYFTLAATDLKP